MEDHLVRQVELLKLDARIATLEDWVRADHAWVCDIVDPNSQSVRVKQIVLVDADDVPRAVIEAGPEGVRIRTTPLPAPAPEA